LVIRSILYDNEPTANAKGREIDAKRWKIEAAFNFELLQNKPTKVCR